VDFHPDKHYDADEQRAASARLRKEHRRERKGAVRELRKDGAFVAREELREKITREREQKDKERRVIAQIQTQEGGESNRYQREKKLRLGKR
jgi:nucleolar protein 14